MDTRPINASLYVNAFNPTGNSGEYSFDSALYNNQADESGNGAFDVKVGFILYVPSTNFNTSTQIPGVIHRYKLTSVTVVNAQTLSGTMVWDEVGTEGLEVPTNGVGCGLSEPSPNQDFGYAPNDTIYPELTAGSTVESVQTDLWNKIDANKDFIHSNNLYKTTLGDDSNLSFLINHSLNTLDVSVDIYEIATKTDVYAGVFRINEDNIQINFTYPIESSSHRVIVRS